MICSSMYSERRPIVCQFLFLEIGFTAYERLDTSYETTSMGLLPVASRSPKDLLPL